MTKNGFAKIADALLGIRYANEICAEKMPNEWSIRRAIDAFDRAVVVVADALEDQCKSFDRDKFFAAIYHR